MIEIRTGAITLKGVSAHGQPAGEPAIDGGTFVFDQPPVRQGPNELVISQTNAAGDSIRVESAEVLVRYRW